MQEVRASSHSFSFFFIFSSALDSGCFSTFAFVFRKFLPIAFILSLWGLVWYNQNKPQGDKGAPQFLILLCQWNIECITYIGLMVESSER